MKFVVPTNGDFTRWTKISHKGLNDEAAIVNACTFLFVVDALHTLIYAHYFACIVCKFVLVEQEERA